MFMTVIKTAIVRVDELLMLPIKYRVFFFLPIKQKEAN